MAEIADRYLALYWIETMLVGLWGLRPNGMIPADHLPGRATHSLARSLGISIIIHTILYLSSISDESDLSHRISACRIRYQFERERRLGFWLIPLFASTGLCAGWRTLEKGAFGEDVSCDLVMGSMHIRRLRPRIDEMWAFTSN